MIPFKRLTRDRRSSTSSSRHPLDLDRDITQESEERCDMGQSDLPPTREGTAFTIEDAEDETQSRGTNDEYFYDEVRKL